jgi:transcriptional regulator of heat shock response
MVLKQDELKARRDAILGMTIEKYIQTVAPISSAFIAKEYPIDISSATIRNIFAELEEEGYLTHPHTSAGRIPTQKGYRYYVDHLMGEIQLLEDEKRRIKSEYEQKSLELENLLDKTSRVLSDVTHYTSIISVDGWSHKIFCQGTNYIVQYPEQQDINKIKEILLALDEKERLLTIINRNIKDKVNIFIGQEMSCREVNSCSLVVSTYQLKDGSTGRMAVLGPTRMDYERVVSALEYFSNIIHQSY